MPKKVTTKEKIKRLRKELDTMVQQILVPLNPRCIVCGGQTNCMHHYIQKKQSSYLRWREENLVPICSHCHTLHHKSGDPRIHQIILMAKGHKWADGLERDRRILYKMTLSNLQETKERWLCRR